jgi:tRNA-2-methylthio-N6-dimethylallyladenosine synthase
VPTHERNRKFLIETFGCQMNALDSERAAAQLHRSGYQGTGDLAEADVILFNTCAVRERPAEKVYARVKEIRRRKKPQAIIGVMGCVAQAEGRRLVERAPEIRLVLGTQAVGQLASLLEEVNAGGEAVIEVRTPNRAEFQMLSPEERRQRHVAYVTIMEGCDKFCTFCIVPFTRGRERSRSAERILAELQALADQGTPEVHLLGQNVNSYGLSRRIEGGERMSFADLLQVLAARSRIPRLKFTTSHPRDFNPEIVRAIETWPALCPWVHLPPQSGSNRILALMNRGYTRDDYLRQVAFIRRAGRDISLTGDIIVGFPGETDQDFQQTVDLVREAEFDGLYIFKYSPRPGTVANKWFDSVPDSLKTTRLQQLVEVQREIQNRLWQRYLGKEVEVLVEGKSAKSGQHWSGHTPCHKVVNFESSSFNLEGLIVKVEITKINPHSLFGRHVEPVLDRPKEVL